MVLQIDCAKQLGTFQLDVALTAEAAGRLVLVGESGAGKTTILNLVAGLIDPDRGSIRLDGSAYFDSDARISVPAHARSIGYVFQDYALFPHLSVFENIAFGLRAQRATSTQLRRRVGEGLEQLGISDLAARHPGQLSGGQQQRVALARALVLQPRLLLLDEPLSALDPPTRRAVRMELRRTLAALPCITVLVTHNPFDALVFGDRIAVLEQGRIVQAGEGHDLLRCPRSRYVADLMGLNFFQGTVVARHADGLVEVRTDGGLLHIVPETDGDELLIAVDPREITLHVAPPSGSAQNVFAGAIVELVPEPPLGERVRVALATHPPLVAEITAHALHALGLREGQRIYASFKAMAARAYN
jgi:molybdate transport system ATP-binding protein